MALPSLVFRMSEERPAIMMVDEATMRS